MGASVSKMDLITNKRLDDALVPVITVGTEAGNAIDVAIQLKDRNGNALAEAALAVVWLSDASKGDVCATAPTGGWAAKAGTDTKLLVALTANKAAIALADKDDGIVSVTITDSGVKTFYINAQIPGDPRIVSAAVAFA
jgi:hypothetical protein